MSDSSSNQAIAEEIVSLQFLLLLTNYAVLSAVAFWFYDFFLTFPTEVRSIWSNRLNGGSVLFILNRYSSLLYVVMQLALLSPGKMTDISCKNIFFISRVSSSIAGAATSLLFILRVYALFGQKRSLLVLLCPFIIMNIVGAFLLSFAVEITNSQGTYAEPFTPCFTGGTLELEMSALFTISPILQMIFDSIIFILTLAKTVQHIRNSRESGIHSIAEVVLHDGHTIFIVASIELGFALESIFPIGTVSTAVGQVTDILSPFLSFLSNILINRFVLNLRACSNHTVQRSGKTLSNKTAPALSVLDFAENRFIVDELENESEHGGGDGEWEIPDEAVDPLTTLVPVIYDYEKGGPVSFVRMQREHGPIRLFF
ncbi:hypothetical protein BDP27DRAFT_1338656 [Rhodocollybia butyracea]|uniref:DUF6533 domain-containing protein n=1 Tax=Rhodocollybia butyracea TaxID=206335 RepID=A0A9P5PDC0_9AGAR|nr:hypothetical protein BDP27DRAFT_1338656 [Rhodocollybia butyracea]